MRLQLSDEEFARIMRYQKRLVSLREQIQKLMGQGNELVDVLNTSWLSANRRVKLENPALVNEDMPLMVDARGNLLVRLNPKDKTAEWESGHDVKRVAVSEAVSERIDETCDEEENCDYGTE